MSGARTDSLSSSEAHYVVAVMTSQVGGPGFAHDVAVREWSAAGLPKPSLIRLAKVVTVEDSLIRRRLAASDAERTRVEFRRMFNALPAPR